MRSAWRPVSSAGRDNGTGEAKEEDRARHDAPTARRCPRSRHDEPRGLVRAPRHGDTFCHGSGEPQTRSARQAYGRPSTKARARDSVQAYTKLARRSWTGSTRILHQPPLIAPIEEFHRGVDREDARPPAALIRATGTRWRMTPATCSTSTGSCTWPARSSGSEASGPGPGSCSSSTVRARPCSCR